MSDDSVDPINLNGYSRKLEKLLRVDQVKFFVRDATHWSELPQKWELANRYNLRKINRESGADFIVTYGNNYNNVISGFSMRQLPACCGICLLTNNHVTYKFTNKGVATLLGKMQKDLAIWCGYTTLLCTGIAHNISQKKALRRNGWRDLWRFLNSRSGNYVDISVLDLDPKRKSYSLLGKPSQAMKVSCKDTLLAKFIKFFFAPLFKFSR